MTPDSDRDRSLRKLPGWDQERVRNARFLVAGAGALGNEVLKNLALLNVGHVVIMDFDHIERSNLSRAVLFREEDCTQHQLKAVTAARRLQELNPAMKVSYLQGDVTTDLGHGLVRRMDAVIGCLDNRLARLYLNRQCHWLGKTWINGGILNLAGQVNVYAPGKACYECELTKQDWTTIRRRLGCTDIARRNSILGQVATSPLSASIIGALQVQEAMKVLFDQQDRSMAGKRFYFDGQFNAFRMFTAKKLKETCDSHFRFPAPDEAPELTATMSLGDLLNYLSKTYEHENPVIELDHGVITGIATLESKQSFDLILPKAHFSDRMAEEYAQVPGEGIGFPPEKLLFRLDRNFIRQDLSLMELGIPPLHIIRVRAGRKTHYVELSGDLPQLDHGGEIKLPNWDQIELEMRKS